jgi:hypothetical protein
MQNFIAEFWASVMLEKARKTLVYGQPGVINRNYQGDIGAKGDTLHITGMGDVEVIDYVDGVDMADAEPPEDSEELLTITQDKAFRFLVTDKQQKQTIANFVNPYIDRAAYRLKLKMDQYVAGLYTDATVANCIGSDASPKVPVVTAGDASNIFNLLADCEVALDDSNIPDNGRFMIVPPWFSALIAKEFHMSGASAPTIGTEAALNGEVARLAGFNILESTNVPNTNGTKYKILYGTPDAITFADQINMVESLRHPKQFADIVRGRQLYGGKVVQPDYLGVMTVSKTA